MTTGHQKLHAAEHAAGEADELTLAAVGAAPSTADYLVGTTQAGLSAEIVVGATPGGELGGTWAAPTVDATHSGTTHAATQAAAEATAAGALAGHVAAGDPHVGYALDTDLTTHAGAADPHTVYVLEGATPGGELGGTYATPTVDATHSGSTHAATQAAAEATAAGALATHEGLADPHTGYRLESADHTHVSTGAQAGQLSATDVFSAGTVPTARLGSGTPDGTTFLRGDQTWAAPTASVTDPNQQSYSPGSFTIATDKYVIMAKTLILTTSQQVVAEGTSRLRIT